MPGKLHHAVRVVLQDVHEIVYQELDSERLPLTLGKHKLFEIVAAASKGAKRIVITAEVSKYP